MAELPDFDTLRDMHRSDPDSLDRLREQLTTELVDAASPERRRRLAGLQFRINMELRRSGNHTARFIRLSGMMQDALCELNYCLNNPLSAARERKSARQDRPKADILTFTPSRSNAGDPTPSNN
jgi:hypothetical protein